jgi:hypothetical protein
LSVGDVICVTLLRKIQFPAGLSALQIVYAQFICPVIGAAKMLRAIYLSGLSAPHPLEEEAMACAKT